jgi:hypothetical protein
MRARMRLEDGPITRHIKTYRDLLQRGPLRLSLLEEGHAKMGSSLHPLASSAEVDVSAFLYSARRLPDCIVRVDRVVMGQTDVALRSSGLIDSSRCRQVQAQSRRRLTLFDGQSTLAAHICSSSDLDDLVPALTCFQMEWNKMHSKLASSDLGLEMAKSPGKILESGEEIRRCLHLSRDDWDTIRKTWGESWSEKFSAIAAGPKDITVELAFHDPGRYRQAMASWLADFLVHFRDIETEGRPVYFVSSNDHSLANLLSGFAAKNREDILAQILKDERLKKRWELLKDDDPGFKNNLLYYSMQAHVRSDERYSQVLRSAEEEVGIRRYEISRFVDLKAQIIEIGRLQPDRMDKRLTVERASSLRDSRALILNVDYPLGLAAYHLLSQLMPNLKDHRGVYVMGKAATMYGRLGDVMIPKVVFDMHSGRLFSFENCFSLRDVRRHLRDSAVFDDQKAVTVKGTFLHNREVMEEFKRDDYNSIEMEAGPYLSAVQESPLGRGQNGETFDHRFEKGLDFGMLHYASDTPYSQRVSLLSKGLGYEGLEATYACTLAILQRILEKEVLRVRRENGREVADPSGG